MNFSIPIKDIMPAFNSAFEKGFCYLCQRKVGKCDHTKPCKGCDKMWINCVCETQKGKKK